MFSSTFSVRVTSEDYNEANPTTEKRRMNAKNVVRIEIIGIIGRGLNGKKESDRECLTLWPHTEWQSSCCELWPGIVGYMLPLLQPLTSQRLAFDSILKSKSSEKRFASSSLPLQLSSEFGYSGRCPAAFILATEKRFLATSNNSFCCDLERSFVDEERENEHHASLWVYLSIFFSLHF